MSQELVGVMAEFREPDNSSSTTLVPDFEFTLKSIPLKMQFNEDTLVVSAGKTVSIVFENPDFMQHNLLIVAPGKLEIVGQAADALMSAPDAAQKNYVPQIPEVLFATRILNPNERVRLTFKAPSRPGAYPFVCTFPGHWRIMNGILIVK
jgi:azurin